MFIYDLIFFNINSRIFILCNQKEGLHLLPKMTSKGHQPSIINHKK